MAVKRFTGTKKRKQVNKTYKMGGWAGIFRKTKFSNAKKYMKGYKKGKVTQATTVDNLKTLQTHYLNSKPKSLLSYITPKSLLIKAQQKRMKKAQNISKVLKSMENFSTESKLTSMHNKPVGEWEGKDVNNYYNIVGQNKMKALKTRNPFMYNRINQIKKQHKKDFKNHLAAIEEKRKQNYLRQQRTSALIELGENTNV